MIKNTSVQKNQDQINDLGFVKLIIGVPGSGKSRLIEEYLSQNVHKFQDILFVTPSGFDNIEIPSQNLNYHFEEQWLLKSLQQLDKQYQQNQNQKKVLIVLDDCVNELQSVNKSKFLGALFNNRRKLIKNTNISFLITSQKYKTIPLTIRTIATELTITSLVLSESKHIEDEWIHQYQDQFNMAVKQLQSVQYGHINIIRKPYEIWYNKEKIAPQEHQGFYGFKH